MSDVGSTEIVSPKLLTDFEEFDLCCKGRYLRREKKKKPKPKPTYRKINAFTVYRTVANLDFCHREAAKWLQLKIQNEHADFS